MNMGWWIALGIAVILVIWLVGSYNSFIKLRNKVEEAFASMDVYLKKRYDLIPNFVETVKGYAKHEQETLSRVIAARNGAVSASTTEEQHPPGDAAQSVRGCGSLSEPAGEYQFPGAPASASGAGRGN